MAECSRLLISPCSVINSNKSRKKNNNPFARKANVRSSWRTLERHMKNLYKRKLHQMRWENRSGNNSLFNFILLKQDIFTPHLHHSSIFYQRQLSNYNFCMHGSSINRKCLHVSLKRDGSKSGCCRHCILYSEVWQTSVWLDRCISRNINWTVTALYTYQRGRLFQCYWTKVLSQRPFILTINRYFALCWKEVKRSINDCGLAIKTSLAHPRFYAEYLTATCSPGSTSQ